MAAGDKDKIGIFMLGINPGAKFVFDINSLVNGAFQLGSGPTNILVVKTTPISR